MTLPKNYKTANEITGKHDLNKINGFKSARIKRFYMNFVLISPVNKPKFA